MSEHTFRLRWHWYSDTEGEWQVVEAPRFGGLQDGAELTLVSSAGAWALVAPDGRVWTGPSPIAALRAEQADRVPADVAVQRIMAELHKGGDDVRD